VLAKQSLGSKSGVALVEVAGRRLLLGVSEHGVTMLTEIEVPDEPVAAPRAERVALDPALLDPALLERSLLTRDNVLVPPSTPAARMPAVPKPRNPLEGSILDAATWRQAVVAVQERTIRR
jgi:flagellar protein FliO/FliZ